MKQVSILLLWAVVSLGCEKPEEISLYRMRVTNQTDKNFWRVVSYYDGGGSQPLVVDFGSAINKSSSEYIPVSSPTTAFCTEIEVSTRERSVRRPREADCQIISFGPFTPGKYTLYISKLTDTGF